MHVAGPPSRFTQRESVTGAEFEIPQGCLMSKVGQEAALPFPAKKSWRTQGQELTHRQMGNLQGYLRPSSATAVTSVTGSPQRSK